MATCCWLVLCATRVARAVARFRLQLQLVAAPRPEPTSRTAALRPRRCCSLGAGQVDGILRPWQVHVHLHSGRRKGEARAALQPPPRPWGAVPSYTPLRLAAALAAAAGQQRRCVRRHHPRMRACHHKQGVITTPSSTPVTPGKPTGPIAADVKITAGKVTVHFAGVWGGYPDEVSHQTRTCTRACRMRATLLPPASGALR